MHTGSHPPTPTARAPASRRTAAAPLRATVLIALLAAWPHASWADGLRWPRPAQAAVLDAEAPADWSPWQGRIGLTLADPAAPDPRPVPLPGWDASGPGLQLHGLRLLGDYYFSPRSGFHATGGLISGSVAQPWSAPVMASGRGLSLTLGSPLWARGFGLDAALPAPRPYLGAGYSLGSADGRWSVSADVGLVGRSPGDAARWGPDAAGWTSLGDRLGQWQVQPLVQLGVSYAF